jgi:DNA-binding NtrC family response regulator
MYESHQPDLVLLDLHLPDISGLNVLDYLSHKGATVVMLTGHGDIATAVQAVKAGAENFLTKPVDFAHLEAVVERALEKARLKRLRVYQSGGERGIPLDGLLGRSPRMEAIAAQIERLARADRTTVLLCGESGTGKGWVAEWIHRLSPRSAGSFVQINCATLTGTFLESELFGHEKGAFTDAKALKRGLLEIAAEGTLFLDEIGALDLNLQPRLLHVLESRTFRRIGGTREISVDVRLIAASNRDLEEAVKKREFREDLYYRLNVMPIELPPLRERSRADVAELAKRLFDDLRRELPGHVETLSADALEMLTAYSWPGNVRELRNVLERALILAGDSSSLEVAHLPRELGQKASRLDAFQTEVHRLSEMEQRHIERVLRRCLGNRTRAAKLLGITRATLHNKINKYGLAKVGLEGD